MNCKICNSETKSLFFNKILNKYQVEYLTCKQCGFIQTEKPYWLNEAYSNAITELDIGLLSRNLNYQPIFERIILKHFDYNKSFIDFAGGYGIFTRLMRDRGFDFYRQDKYCENLFAKNFDIADKKEEGRYELLIAMEVFEHLENPYTDIDIMFSYADNILFTTELIPENLKSIDDWWYFAPETGQHISFYTNEALTIIAKKYGVNLYSDGKCMHLFTKKELRLNPFQVKSNGSFKIKLLRKGIALLSEFISKEPEIKLEGKLQDDYNQIKSKLNEGTI